MVKMIFILNKNALMQEEIKVKGPSIKYVRN